MSDPALTPEQNVERRKRLRNRNVALAIALAAFVLLFYVVTLVKGVPLIASRPI